MTTAPMADLTREVGDETAAVEDLVGRLDQTGWDAPTPSEPWTVQDQIGHLAYFDEQATLAVTQPSEFAAGVERDGAAIAEDVAALHRSRGLDGAATLDWWRQARDRMLEVISEISPETRIPWYGPPMRGHTFLVARLMETWAHGVDVADALGTALPVTDRLFHIADLGVRTFSWSFVNRGLEVPDDRVRVALRGPSGATRVWNDSSTACVTGPVEEFSLVVVQRRRVADTHLVLEGGLARRWMEIAQVFAGPPGPGR